eukprot:3796034-Prymnesium_polylepis.1
MALTCALYARPRSSVAEVFSTVGVRRLSQADALHAPLLTLMGEVQRPYASHRDQVCRTTWHSGS